MSDALAGLAVPIVAAPMAGGPSTPELVTAVGGAGGLGFLAGALIGVDALADQVAHVRSAGVFGVNLFLPTERVDTDLSEHLAALDRWAARYGVRRGEARWDDDDYPAKLDWLLTHPVPVVSCTFGCPPAEVVAAVQGVGSEVWVTVTTPDDAVLAAQVGADALVVQGFEAGGHRGTFGNSDPAGHVSEHPGLLALLRQVSAGLAGRGPVLVAAGGLITGADVAAVLAAGAGAAQLGTAFLLCPEAGTTALHRAAVSSDRVTAVTRAFSGRPARGVRNAFLDERGDRPPAAYPQLNNAGKSVRAAAAAAGDDGPMSLWAGQTHALARPLPAAQLVAALGAEARSAIAAAATRLR